MPREIHYIRYGASPLASGRSYHLYNLEPYIIEQGIKQLIYGQILFGLSSELFGRALFFENFLQCIVIYLLDGFYSRDTTFRYIASEREKNFLKEKRLGELLNWLYRRKFLAFCEFRNFLGDSSFSVRPTLLIRFLVAISSLWQSRAKCNFDDDAPRKMDHSAAFNFRFPPGAFRDAELLLAPNVVNVSPFPCG